MWGSHRSYYKGKIIMRNDKRKHARALTILILLLSGDVELNPGPNQSTYLCPYCDLMVDYGMKAIQCDFCDMWYHKTCISMCTKDYENLVDNSISFLCCRCDHPTHTKSLVTHEIATSNSYSVLAEENTQNEILDKSNNSSFHPAICSSPKDESLKASNLDSNDSLLQTQRLLDLPDKGGNWRTIVVNANGITGKLAELESLIETTQPDQILMTETKLGNDDRAAENKLDQLGYKTYSCHRKKGGGGVMIAIRHNFLHHEIQLLDDPSDEIKFKDHPGVLKWIEVIVNNKTKLYVGVFYRQPNANKVQLQCLEKSLQIIKKRSKNNPNSTIMIGGDFNCGDIDWDHCTVLPTSDKKSLHNRLLDMISDYSLEQHQREPTRNDRILDLFMTNKPNMVRSMNTVAGISDHEIPVADCELKPKHKRMIPRQIFLWQKADWEKLKEEMTKYRDDFLKKASERTVEENWRDFKKHIKEIMDTYIPSKSTSMRHNLPWKETTPL